jgi:hypothetical protein
MPIFDAVHVSISKDNRCEGWAVQRTEPDGLKIVVTKIFDGQQEAVNEAARLNRDASRGVMS